MTSLRSLGTVIMLVIIAAVLQHAAALSVHRAVPRTVLDYISRVCRFCFIVTLKNKHAMITPAVRARSARQGDFF